MKRHLRSERGCEVASKLECTGTSVDELYERGGARSRLRKDFVELQRERMRGLMEFVSRV